MVSAVGIAAGAVAAGAAILRLEADNALQSGPSYIKDGQPESLTGKIGQAIARQACRRYADGVDSLLDEATADFETVCRPYLDNVGYGTGPGLAKPFDGGQCSALYTFNVVTTGPTGAGNGVCGTGIQNGTTANALWGPISGIRRGATFCVGPNGTASNWEMTAYGTGAQGSPNATPQSYVVATSAYTAVPGGFTRAGGQPDDCGNPPPELIDPVPPPEPGPDTEPYNPEPGIDVDITVVLQPDALIEVNLGFGPIIINPFGGRGGDDGGGPTDPPSPPAPEPGPELPGGNGGFGGDDNFGEPPAGRRWVGCCIRITQTPDNSGIIIGSQPEDVYPSVVGNIRLVCNAAGNRLTDTPVRILAKHVCVWEPVAKLNPTGVNVDLLPGYGYVFTPFSVPLED